MTWKFPSVRIGEGVTNARRTLFCGSRRIYPAASPKILIHTGKISRVDTKKIKAVYKSDNFIDTCKINGVSIVPELDIALCDIEFQKEYQGPDFTYQIGLDSRPPKKGDEVLAVGYSGMKSDQKQEKIDGKKRNIAISRRFEVRRGKVTGVFNMGVGEVNWPCFETTIPIDAGMNGGLEKSENIFLGSSDFFHSKQAVGDQEAIPAQRYQPIEIIICT